MKTLNTITTKVEPKLITTTPDGYGRYAYKIHKVTTKDRDFKTGEIKEGTGYSFILVDNLPARPSKADIILAIIRMYITADEEFDLINSYNKMQLGMKTDSETVEKYKEYLELLEDIKTTVNRELDLYNAEKHD